MVVIMIKKLILIILTLFSCFTAYAEDDIKIFYNNKRLTSDVAPFIENDRTLVPVRLIMETFGFTVSWDEPTKTAKIKSDTKTISLTKDSNVALINDKKVTLDAKAKIVSDRIFVPIRFVSENFGYKVLWDDLERSVLISDVEKTTPTPTPTPTPKPTATPTPAPAENNITIKKISAKSSEDKLSVIIEGDKKLPSPKTMTLEAPLRYVIDFEGAVLGADLNEITIDSEFAQGIRFAQNSLNPNIVRVVVDLKQKPIFKPTLKDNTYTLDIGNEKMNAPNMKVDYKADISKKLVVIDPGHGGNEPGAIVKYNEKDVFERDINLYIGKKVYEILKADGINVIATRLTDKTVSLEERVRIANNANATLFVSIHNNALEDTAVKGTLTLYAYDSPKVGQVISDYEVATIMQKELLKGTGGYNRNLLRNPNIYVTKATKMPALLCECLFMTNEDDLKILMNNKNLDKIAQNIAAGTKKCLEAMPLVEVISE